jgi:hypothetical protein
MHLGTVDRFEVARGARRSRNVGARGDGGARVVQAGGERRRQPVHAARPVLGAVDRPGILIQHVLVEVSRRFESVVGPGGRSPASDDEPGTRTNSANIRSSRLAARRIRDERLTAQRARWTDEDENILWASFHARRRRTRDSSAKTSTTDRCSVLICGALCRVDPTPDQ